MEQCTAPRASAEGRPCVPLEIAAYFGCGPSKHHGKPMPRRALFGLPAFDSRGPWSDPETSRLRGVWSPSQDMPRSAAV